MPISSGIISFGLITFDVASGGNWPGVSLTGISPVNRRTGSFDVLGEHVGTVGKA